MVEIELTPFQRQQRERKQRHERIVAMANAGASYREIASAFNCGQRTISRAIHGYKLKSNIENAMPVPDKFIAIAPRLSIAEAARRFGVHTKTVERWAKVAGIQFKSAFREMPADFEANYRRMSIEALAKHYRASPATCRKFEAMMPADAVAAHKEWIAINRRASMKALHAERRKSAPPKPKRKQSPGRGVSWGSAKPVPVPEAKADIVSMAMRHLQRDYIPVCRSETIAGKAAAGLFKVGRMVLDEAGLLALAARKGFAPVSGFAG